MAASSNAAHPSLCRNAAVVTDTREALARTVVRAQMQHSKSLRYAVAALAVAVSTPRCAGAMRTCQRLEKRITLRAVPQQGDVLPARFDCSSTQTIKTCCASRPCSRELTRRVWHQLRPQSTVRTWNWAPLARSAPLAGSSPAWHTQSPSRPWRAPRT
eukprot:6194142-Pleurochrysis_carterae.AAC.1